MPNSTESGAATNATTDTTLDKSADTKPAEETTTKQVPNDEEVTIKPEDLFSGEEEKPKVEAPVAKTDEDDEDDDAVKMQQSINSQVSASLEPAKEETRKLVRLNELNDFLSEPGNEHFRPFKQVLKEIVTDKRVSRMKTENVIYAALGKSLMQLGAKKEREAQKTQQRNSSPGTVTSVPNAPASDWKELKGEAFKDYIRKIAPGARV